MTPDLTHVTEMAHRALAPRMIEQCSWCKREMGSKPCRPDQDGKITGGICPACAATFRAKE